MRRSAGDGASGGRARSSTGSCTSASTHGGEGEGSYHPLKSHNVPVSEYFAFNSQGLCARAHHCPILHMRNGHIASKNGRIHLDSKAYNSNLLSILPSRR